MPCAFKPVEDICAPGVVDLVKRVSVRLLDSHSVAKSQKYHAVFSHCCAGILTKTTFFQTCRIQVYLWVEIAFSP